MGAMEIWEKAHGCCFGCKHFFNPKDDVFICKKVDKFLLPDFMPSKCEEREE